MRVGFISADAAPVLKPTLPQHLPIEERKYLSDDHVEHKYSSIQSTEELIFSAYVHTYPSYDLYLFLCIFRWFHEILPKN